MSNSSSPTRFRRKFWRFAGAFTLIRSGFGPGYQSVPSIPVQDQVHPHPARDHPMSLRGTPDLCNAKAVPPSGHPNWTVSCCLACGLAGRGRRSWRPTHQYCAPALATPHRQIAVRTSRDGETRHPPGGKPRPPVRSRHPNQIDRTREAGDDTGGPRRSARGKIGFTVMFCQMTQRRFHPMQGWPIRLISNRANCLRIMQQTHALAAWQQ